MKVTVVGCGLHLIRALSYYGQGRARSEKVSGPELGAFVAPYWTPKSLQGSFICFSRPQKDRRLSQLFKRTNFLVCDPLSRKVYVSLLRIT